MAGGAPGDDRKRSRYIWIRGKKDQSSWEWMRRLARNWDEIEQLVGELGDGPWFVTVNLTSVVVSYHRDPVTGGFAGRHPIVTTDDRLCHFPPRTPDLGLRLR